MEKVTKRLSRRDFFKGSAMVAGAIVASQINIAHAQEPKTQTQLPKNFQNIVDLTHTLSPEFPTYSGNQQFSMKSLMNFADNGFNVNEWTVTEHTGTHIDVPLHFSADKAGVDEIPVTDLIVPLAVIDIKAKASQNADAMVSTEDIQAYETEHGRLPEGCCVAMNSGWSDKADTNEFRNTDANSTMHFPGFSIEAVQFLIEKRNVRGIAVDTLSLDTGSSTDFPVHYAWLPSGRWGIENLANIDSVPASGAFIFVGAPKVKGASGGPSRIIAMF